MNVSIISHRLIHLYNADNGAGKYRDYIPVFASNLVSAMAYNSYFKERCDLTLDFLQETLDMLVVCVAICLSL
jgi:urease alpha subunit